MAKKRISIKPTPGKARQLSDALTLLEQHYAPLVAEWPHLTEWQRDAVRADSPLLVRLVELARGLA